MIIDGRIADICETGFLDGDLIIPQFVCRTTSYWRYVSEDDRTRTTALDILKMNEKKKPRLR